MKEQTMNVKEWDRDIEKGILKLEEEDIAEVKKGE